MADIKAGDTVQLKSGGPLMTVTEIQDIGGGSLLASCVWFDGTKQMNGVFRVVALKPVTPP